MPLPATTASSGLVAPADLVCTYQYPADSLVRPDQQSAACSPERSSGCARGQQASLAITTDRGQRCLFQFREGVDFRRGKDGQGNFW